jgi:hypothetical protein
LDDFIVFPACPRGRRYLPTFAPSLPHVPFRAPISQPSRSVGPLVSVDALARASANLGALFDAVSDGFRSLAGLGRPHSFLEWLTSYSLRDSALARWDIRTGLRGKPACRN